MRFAAPRTPSPKPHRPKRVTLTPKATGSQHIPVVAKGKGRSSSQWRERSRSTYGLYSDSDSDEFDPPEEAADEEELNKSQRRTTGAFSAARDTDEEEEDGLYTTDDTSPEDEDSSWSEADEYSYASSEDEDGNKARANSSVAGPSRALASPAQRRQLEDDVAAIRLHTRHHDPYEEWEKQTRREAFKAARKERHDSHQQLSSTLVKSRAVFVQNQTARLTQEATAIRKHLDQVRDRTQADNVRLQATWNERERIMVDRVERSIKEAEEKVRKRVEEERKRVEEEKRKEDEERKKEEEERKKQVEKRRKEQEQQAQEAKERMEAEEKKKVAEIETKKKEEEEEKIKKLHENTKAITGFESARDDWVSARTTLKELKEGPIKRLKSHSEMKKIWGKYRRMITPKIGQLTNDAQSIQRIMQDVKDIVVVQPPHPPTLYAALLSSLAKAILLQAETEITASPISAVPLAKVTTRLLLEVPQFADIFYARILHRAGGWFIPAAVPSQDIDGKPWGSTEALAKAHGRRENGAESGLEMMTRVAGIMRLYWEIVKCFADPNVVGAVVQDRWSQVDARYVFGRTWVWFSRLTTRVDMLKEPIAAELISVGLSVIGTQAKAVYGRQWVKLLELLYRGVTQGVPSPDGSGTMFTIGGASPEGKAAKVRVQLEIERVMSS